MERRLAQQPARPRTRGSLPAYPTLAAAGLAFCLTGCAPAGTVAAPFERDAASIQPEVTRDSAPDESPVADGVSEAGRAALDTDRADAGVALDGPASDPSRDGSIVR
jgi:hypothetical protein